MVGVDIEAYKQIHRPSPLTWCEGRQLLGTVLHSSDEPSETYSRRQQHKHVLSRPILLQALLLLLLLLFSSEQSTFITAYIMWPSPCS